MTPTAIEANNSVIIEKGLNKTNFGNVFKEFLQSAIEQNKNAEKVGYAAVEGNADITNIVGTLTKAEIALKSIIAIKDKLTIAYQDIMKMSI